ncbi:MAG TPA: hypothetical protein VHB77_06850 [Planctomycetaceae bacterium]|nr:hypothetical protein [Planctomycetaceae bacterium]
MSLPRRPWFARPLGILALAMIRVVLSTVLLLVYGLRRSAALAYVEARGNVEFVPAADWWPHWSRTVIDISIINEDECDLNRITALHEAASLNLIRCKFADGSFPAVRRFTRLQHLGLGFSKISGIELQLLQGLPLKELWLTHTRVSDADLHCLAGLPVRELSLGSTAITDDGLRELRGLPLEKLWLDHTRITDAGLAHLRELPLRHLSLNYTPISDDGLRHLDETAITQLSLLETRVTAASRRMRNRTARIIELGN